MVGRVSNLQIQLVVSINLAPYPHQNGIGKGVKLVHTHTHPIGFSLQFFLTDYAGFF